ncbi:MAG: hypothetical protein ABEL76_00595 [Bradymonadaceae bacterium]
MEGFVATTDQNWFEFLSNRDNLREFNFRQPSGRPPVETLGAGAPSRALLAWHRDEEFLGRTS